MPSLLESVAAEAGSASSESRRLRTGSSATAAATGSSMTSTANIDMAIESLTSFLVKTFYGLFCHFSALVSAPELLLAALPDRLKIHRIDPAWPGIENQQDAGV